MAKISKRSITRVLADNDLVEVVGQYVQLKRAGNRWMGLCPFHADSQPSFYVTPELGDHGLFRCFGCGAGGDAIKFLMLKESLAFADAVEALADRRGITLDYEEGGGPRERPVAGRYELLDWAASLFQESLWGREGRPGRDLLDRRGVAEDLARRFHLGWSPDRWDFLLTAARREGRDLDALEKLGLVRRSQERKSLYDQFRNRLIYPIHNAMGRVVGFGGRALGDERQKYVNSTESDLFAKRKLLYALHLAREAIRQKGLVLLCEGYMDVIALHGAGFTHAVAGLGTALAEDNVRTLKRLTPEVALLYDSDDAGRKATQRAILLLQKEEIQTRVVEFPAGEDPDDFVRKNGAEALERKIAAAPDAFDYWLATSLAGRDLKSGQHLSEILRDMAQLLTHLPSGLARVRLRERLSERIGASDEAELVSMAITPERAARVQADRLAEIFQVDVKVVERELARHGVVLRQVKKRTPYGKWLRKAPPEEPGAPLPHESRTASDPAMLARKGLLSVLAMGWRNADYESFWDTPEGRDALVCLEAWIGGREAADRVEHWIKTLRSTLVRGERLSLSEVLHEETEDAALLAEALDARSSPATAFREIKDYLNALNTLEEDRNLDSLQEEIRSGTDLSMEEKERILKKVQRHETNKHLYT